MESNDLQFHLRIKGTSCVFIDWANVYNWKRSLKKEIDPVKLHSKLADLGMVKEIRFYFGSDSSSWSSEFLKSVENAGYTLVTKPVKLLRIYDEKDKAKYILRRKCDFDLEIGLDAYERIDKYKTFIFFSGDGDFATLYRRLSKKKKQIIVIYMHGHLGREIWAFRDRVYKHSFEKLNWNVYKGNAPPITRGAR